MKNKRFSIMLTCDEANTVWGLLDGALDAGCCEGGLTEAERDAAHKVSSALLTFFHAMPEDKK